MRGTPLWTDQERRALARRLRFVIGQAQGLALTQAARETLATSENTRHQRGGRAPGRLGWGPFAAPPKSGQPARDSGSGADHQAMYASLAGSACARETHAEAEA
jgi:hypothetical protein